jgi:hypothetical protein
MAPALAFLPWVEIDKSVEIGPVRLMPYLRGRSPGNQPNASQSDIDGVLSAYANRPRNKIRKAAILEYGDWCTGMDPQDVLPTLFRARNAIAFAALSHRQLFRRSSEYCNYDTYTLVVQRYRPGDVGTFSFATRRRDGGTNQLWSTDEFAFHRPNHVEPHAKFSVDHPLLAALLGPLDSKAPFQEAVIEFNCANTDSPDVPDHVEVVLVKSAFEWLFGIKEQANAFVAALTKCIEDIPPANVLDGPLKVRWKNARPNATRPLEAWAREFCDIRGASAHGRARAASRFVWSAHAHLAFASLLFPLVFKKVVANMGLLTLHDYDVQRLRRIDAYVLHDPFTFDWMAADAAHPWAELDTIAFVYAGTDSISRAFEHER